MKALKTFIKPFEEPQGSVKMKFYDDIYLNTIFWNVPSGKG